MVDVEPPEDQGPAARASEEAEEFETERATEERYRWGVGITLALLALLGAWIALLATDAATNESNTTREATRLGAEAQTAEVVAQGAEAGIEQILAEVAQLGSRPGFQVASTLESQGIELDPESEAERLAQAQAQLEAATAGATDRRTATREQAAGASLEQTAVVAERVTWNARASQYETVLTVLAVAVFLVGFTMVVSRGLRPPFVVPGTVLAVVCFGWALQIHAKPIPRVAPEAIEATAAGQVATDEGRPEDAVVDFTRAVDAQGDYAAARRGLGVAILTTGNPDLLRTWAITDDSPALTDPATAELEEAVELAGDDAVTLTAAAIAAVVRSDWADAAGLIEDALAENERAPGLLLSRSAVAVAEGDGDLARSWLDRAVPELTELAGTDTDRALAAQYLTLLEWVTRQAPEHAALAGELRDQAILFIARAREAATPQADIGSGAAPAGATIAVETLEYRDDTTTARFAVSGVASGQQVIIAVYERPSPGGPWVQAPELFYVGEVPPGEGFTFRTPRACHPLEYRVDLYVDGVAADSTTSPGTVATC